MVDELLERGHLILDTAYIERWAEEWEVIDRWREATRNASLALVID